MDITPNDPMNENPNDDLSLSPEEELSEELAEIDPEALAESLNQFQESSPPPQEKVPEKVQEQVSAQAEAQIAELTTENKALKAQADELKEQYIRLRADFDNFRKRVERDKEELEARLSGKFLERFLPVLDDFERAQSQIVPKTDGETQIHRSYQSVYKQLQKSIKEAGLTKMETIGQPFDPHYHEAIAQEPSPLYPENIICDELRGGYMIGDRVVRPALVKVSSEKIAPPSENLTAEG
jgi:molecular chaperone GrpE